MSCKATNLVLSALPERASDTLFVGLFLQKKEKKQRIEVVSDDMCCLSCQNENVDVLPYKNLKKYVKTRSSSFVHTRVPF